MAFGYARSTGRPGVYAVVPGPGVLNSTAALSSAYATSTPLVCVTGEVPSAFIGAGKGHLHELPDQLATLRTLTKWAANIDEPADVPALVAQAFAQATTGRPRPVALAMPWDALERSGGGAGGAARAARHARARRGRGGARRAADPRRREPDDHGRRRRVRRRGRGARARRARCRRRWSRSAAARASSRATTTSGSAAPRALSAGPTPTC